MIKLFWNTHNQNKPNPNKSNKENARDKQWGLYHKDYSDKWIYEILNKIKFKNIRKQQAVRFPIIHDLRPNVLTWNQAVKIGVRNQIDNVERKRRSQEQK